MSDDATARLGLPYLAAGQMQKHVTLNEALTRLDALAATAVASRTVSAQPVTAPDGLLHILPAGATGADWTGGAAGTLMRAESGDWTEIQAPAGLVVLVVDEGLLLVRDESGWSPVGARLGEVRDLARLGVGAAPDGDNPFVARLDKALWTARDPAEGGGDLRFTMNKAGPDGVLSLLLQSGWSGRAELGLVGEDDFSLRVSADGSAWTEVLGVDRATGRTSFARGALRAEATILDADGSWSPPSWARLLRITAIGGGGGGARGSFGASGDRPGGAGGGGGGRTDGEWPVEALAFPLTLTVGAGGAGATSGAVAEAGDPSLVVTAEGAVVLSAGGGSAGHGAGGAGGFGAVRGNPGGAPGREGESFARGDAPGGGGGGGGLDPASVPQAAGAGGAGGAVGQGPARGAGGAAGAVDSPGGTGSPPADPELGWAGGGGGGGGASLTTGRSGGPGALGGGGGGGGAGVASGGAGGPGGAGLVRILALG